MSVALLDLQRQFRTVETEVRARMDEVLRQQSFILGRTVEEFEAAVAEYLGVEHAIGLASGTDALLLPLLALDLRPGDEVVVPPFTFFATAGAVHNAGGTPVFADVDPDTFNLDPDAVRRAITPRTRAIVPVHLYGQMAPMRELREIADRHGLFLMEDAAQAIGARQRVGGQDVGVGAVGDAASLSFFPSKNLGGFGDGGMVVTRRADVAQRMRRLRTHGGTKMYHHDEVGTNSRLDALQAAILGAKLPHLDGWNEARRAHARWYGERLRPLQEAGHLAVPVVAGGNEHVYHQYTLRATRRDALREHLGACGIGCAVYYPVPLHLQPCFAYLGRSNGDFPASERLAAEAISLPIYPELTGEEREEVASAVEAFYRGDGRA